MRKIGLVFLMVLALTACGNKDVKENNIQNDGTVINNVQNVSENASESTVIKSTGNIEVDIICGEGAEVVEVSDVSNQLEKDAADKKYENGEGIEIDKKAIDFEVELLSGEKVKLSSFLGKPVFLNFWATWCGPCIGEMPDIEKMKSEYGDKIVILAINSGELKKDVQTFIGENKYTFNIGIDEKGEIASKYDSMYIPLSVFIDKDGIIRERKFGALSEEDMKKIINELVNDK